jgi:protein SPT2
MAKISDLLAQITGDPSPTTSSFPQFPKPKSDEGVRRPLDKAKASTEQPASSSKSSVDPRKPSVEFLKTKPANGSSRGPATAFNNGQPTPPPSNDVPKAPPKKGSYAEIMARGQAAQKVLGQVGKIQHKKIEKIPSRREREEMRAQRAVKIQKGMAPNSKFQKSGQISLQEGKAASKKRVKAAESVPEKKVKKAALATTGYAGTARPKPGASVRPGTSTSTSSRYKDRYGREGSGHRGSRYDDYDDDEAEEEEEEEEEEELDYQSDVSSDMEAAAFEVDEEEAMAERIARREDAEALAEENRLKREKAEKKRRLIAMAKKAKPMSY